MALIENHIVKSRIPYNFKLPPGCLQKNLATIFFEERQKNYKEDNIDILDAKNPRAKLLASELQPKSELMAKSLKACGFQKGDTIQVMTQNNVDFFTPVLAAWLCGGVASIVNPNTSVQSLINQLKITNISIIFCLPKIFEIVKEAAENTEDKISIVVMDQFEDRFMDCSSQDNDKYCSMSWSEFLKKGEDTTEKANETNFNGNETVMIFWSSGTTGTPKGIMYSFEMLARQLIFEETAFSLPLPPNEMGHFIMTTNFFHAGGFHFAFTNGIRNGNTVIIFSAKDENNVVTAQDLQQACHDYKVTLMKIGSHHAIQLGYASPNSNFDLTALKYVMPMGAPVHFGLTAELRSIFPNFQNLLINYGSTEFWLVSYSTVPGELGLPARGVEYKIQDKNTGEFCGPNQPGEILVKTPFLMKGYVLEEQNNDFFAPEGFVYSGDVGYYKPDGTLVFQARCKELIKYQGNHLYPMELENIIQKHPAVAEVAVFGLPHPEVQELVSAIVVKKSEVMEDEIKQLLIDAKVENYKFIRGGVKFASKIPKNATGKILRSELPILFQRL